MADGAARTFFIETFGCQMNRADSEVILGQLAGLGFVRCDDAAAADLVVYNTCSVRDGAEAKVRGRLDACRYRKRPGQKLVVMGCMAQRLGRDILDRWPHVDLVAGSDQFASLPTLLQRLDQEGRLAETGFADQAAAGVTPSRGDGINAWVPVMRGCNYRCTYCVVPGTRGTEKSRSPDEIEAEVRAAVAAGKVQVTLLGQTVDAYGRTRGDGSTLAGLLRRLHAIDGLLRLRFVTSHPKDISDDLLRAMAGLPKVATHLHIPVQSGSDRILLHMGRRYGRADYLEVVRRARAAVPGLELLTDLIVGFPGESDADFADTRSLMDEVGFDGAFVFMYSPRPGTAAAGLADDVPAEVKRRRCNELLRRQLAHQERVHQALVGSTLEVLVEGPSTGDATRLAGRSRGNRLCVFPRDGRDHLVGRLVTVRIARATNLTLFGDLA